jgi:hypothetical protein
MGTDFCVASPAITSLGVDDATNSHNRNHVDDDEHTFFQQQNECGAINFRVTLIIPF